MTVFVVVLVLQILAGTGVLASTSSRIPKSMVLPIALLLGMFTHTVLFFCIDLLHLGFSVTTLLTTAVFGVVLTHLRMGYIQQWYRWLFSDVRFTLSMYDVVTLSYALSTAYYVVWATWYWPVTPFDAMAGIDLVAREAVQEGTIANRVFHDASLRGYLSNQPFYAPFAMLLQVMYRLMGFMYGQIWLGIVAISASWMFWAAMRQVVHRFVANTLWVLLILTPELLGYTYLLQTDYLNAAYFASGVILLYLTFDKGLASGYWPAALLFAGACWSRTETIMLVGIGMVFTTLLWKSEVLKGRKRNVLLGTLAASAIVFLAWNLVYLQWYLPVRPDTMKELVGFSISRFAEVSVQFVANVLADYALWALTFILFIAALIWNVVSARTPGSSLLLVWIGAVLVGLVLVGTIFSAAVVEQTLRRGVFKLVPLAFLYVASSPTVVALGNRIKAWEERR